MMNTLSYLFTRVPGFTGLSLDNPLEKVNDPLDLSNSIAVYVGFSILFLVLLTIFLERRHFNRVAINFLRFFALCAFPLFILPFASFSLFEGSHKVKFCATCHTAMDLYVSDMKDNRSATLASVHYRNRYIQESHCYTCHAGYSMLDIGKAKASGLLHLYYWVNRSPTALGKQQIKLYGREGYKNELCLNCHSGSREFLAAEEGIHKKLESGLLGEDPDTGASKISCMFCHGPAHLTLKEKKSPKILVAQGLVEGQPGENRYPSLEPGKNLNPDRPYESAPPAVPHKVTGYPITRSRNSCLEPCHSRGLEKIPPSHFVNEHTGRSGPGVTGIRYHCLQCHLPQVADEPPVTPKPHYGQISQKSILQPLTALVPASPAETQFLGAGTCAYCHQSRRSGNQYGKWKTRNHAHAFKDLATERGKEIAKAMKVTGDPQQSGKCLKCHSTGYDSEHPINPNTGFALEDGVQCEQCHGPGSQYINLPTMQGLARGDIPPESVGLKKPDQKFCKTCHDPAVKHVLPFKAEERFRKIQHWN